MKRFSTRSLESFSDFGQALSDAIEADPTQRSWVELNGDMTHGAVTHGAVERDDSEMALNFWRDVSRCVSAP